MLKITELTKLHLGVKGENKANTVRVDMSPWAEEFPGATFSVIFKPYGSTNVYPMTTTYDSETKVLSWVITSAVTATDGKHETEFRATESESGLVKKTKTIESTVEKSVTGTETTPPDPEEDWVTQVLNAKEAAEDAQEAAEAAQDAAEEAQNKAEIAAGIAIAQAGQIKFEINEAGHLIFSYTDEVPVAEEEEDNE